MTRDRILSESTKITLGLVLIVIPILLTCTIAGSFWVSGVDHSLVSLVHAVARIEKKLGISSELNEVAHSEEKDENRATN